MKIKASLILIFSIISALVFAYVAEYAYLYAPCPLCLYQRYILFTLLLPLLIPQLRILFWPILFASFAVNIYHIGLEQNLWHDVFEGCHVGLTTGGDLEAFRTQFGEDPVHHCGEIEWKILGISALFWTFALNLFLSVFGFLWSRDAKAS